MCWELRVFFHVSGNLAERFGRSILDKSYKILWTCYCKKSIAEEIVHSSADDSSDTNDADYANKPIPWDNTGALEKFYKNVDRGEAEDLLESRQNGTFLIRPSEITENIGTLSIVQDSKIFHLAVRIRRDGQISLGIYKPHEKCFRDLSQLIDFYVSNYLLVFSQGVAYSTLLIPLR